MGLHGRIRNDHRYRQNSFKSQPATERTGGIDCKELQSSAGGDGCGLLRFHLEPQIQNSIFKIQNDKLGTQPAEVAHDCKELRASAAPRLRPARPFQGRISSMPLNLCPRAAACEAPARADAKADASCGPSRGEAAARRSLRDRFCRCILIVRYSGCSLRSARTAFSRPKFKIHDSKFKIQNHELRNVLTGNKLLAKRRASLIVRYSGSSLRSARKFGYELRASAAPRLRPAGLFETEIPSPSTTPIYFCLKYSCIGTPLKASLFNRVSRRAPSLAYGRAAEADPMIYHRKGRFGGIVCSGFFGDTETEQPSPYSLNFTSA